MFNRTPEQQIVKALGTFDKAERMLEKAQGKIAGKITDNDTAVRMAAQALDDLRTRIDAENEALRAQHARAARARSKLSEILGD